MPDRSEALAESLRALSRFLIGEETPREALLRIARIGEAALPGAVATGLTMLDDGRPHTAVFTAEKAPEVDQLQYDEGDGPCLSAYRTATVVRVDSLRTDERWPRFGARACDHGIHSSLSVPLALDGRALGALNFYGQVESAFSDEDAQVGLGFAVQAAIVLANAQAYWGARQRAVNLDEAMRSRAVIEQAKGIIMARSHVPAEEAFDILVRASQRENRKLRTIATELVERAQQADADLPEEAEHR